MEKEIFSDLAILLKERKEVNSELFYNSIVSFLKRNQGRIYDKDFPDIVKFLKDNNVKLVWGIVMEMYKTQRIGENFISIFGDNFGLKFGEEIGVNSGQLSQNLYYPGNLENFIKPKIDSYGYNDIYNEEGIYCYFPERVLKNNEQIKKNYVFYAVLKYNKGSLIYFYNRCFIRWSEISYIDLPRYFDKREDNEVGVTLYLINGGSGIRVCRRRRPGEIVPSPYVR